jgi:regulator of replication initiation timing
MHQLISRKNSYVYNNFRKVYEDWKFICNRFYIKGIVNKKDSDILFIALTISYHSIFNGDLA